jgi:alpha-glucosidase
MIRIRKESSAIRTGSLRILTHDVGILSYVRFNQKEQVVVALNNTDKVKKLIIPVWIGGLPMEGVMKRVMYSYEDGYVAEPEKVVIRDGEVILSMGAYSAVVLKSATHKDFENNFWRG